MKIKFTRSVFVAGTPYEAGTTAEIPAPIAAELVARGSAIPVETREKATLPKTKRERAAR